MKRFYQQAELIEAEEGFSIALGGKPLLTPAKHALRVQNRALAEAIAAEWQGQDVTLTPSTMPLTRLASTAIDRVAPRRAEIVAEIAKYAQTDLLSYRADEPPELILRQEQIWQPIVDWASARFDAALRITRGITPVPQPKEALAAITRAVDAYDAMHLVALHLATTACGSVLLGLALLHRRLSPDEAFAAAQIDESFQIERWGEDPEQTARRAALREDIALAARFAALLSGE